MEPTTGRYADGDVSDVVGEGGMRDGSLEARGGGPGYDGVRHPGRGSGGDRDHRHHGVPAQAARTVGRHRGGYQRIVGKARARALRDERGQGTVEYALVMAAFLAALVALGALWRVLEGGLFVEHALASASHHVQLASPGNVADVFLY